MNYRRSAHSTHLERRANKPDRYESDDGDDATIFDRHFTKFFHSRTNKFCDIRVNAKTARRMCGAPSVANL